MRKKTKYYGEKSMKGKNLLILLILAALLVVGALMTRKQTPYAPPSAIGKLLLPNLTINDIVKVTIKSKTAITTLIKVNGEWVVLDMFNYPVDFKKLRNALTELNDLKISSVIPVSPQQLSALQLNPPAKSSLPHEAGTLVEFYTKGISIPTSILIGKTHENEAASDQPYGGYPDGRYVSPDNGKNVYLIAKLLNDLTTDRPDNWINKNLTKVPSSKLKSINITGANQTDINIVLSEKDGKLELKGINEDEEVEATNLAKITSILTNLQMSNPASPSISDEVAGFTNSITFKALTKDNLEYTILVGEKKASSSERYIKISTAFIPSASMKNAETVNEAIINEEVNAKNKEKEDQKAELAKTTQKESEQFNKKFAKWTYLISNNNAESLIMKRESLVKKKEKAEAEEEKDANK